MSEPKTARKRDRRLLLMGFMILAIGTIWSGMQVYAVSTWERATAKVVSVETVDSGSGSNRSRTYRPRLKFVDHNGKTREVSTAYSSGQFKFDRGEEVPVIFRRDDPTHFRITTFSSYWIWPLVAVIVGALVIGFTIRSRPDGETTEAETAND